MVTIFGLLRQLRSFPLIMNDAWSDDGLNKRPKLETIFKLLMVLLHDSVVNKYIDTHGYWKFTLISQETCLRKSSILRPWPFCWAEPAFPVRACDSSIPLSQNGAKFLKDDILHRISPSYHFMLYTAPAAYIYSCKKTKFEHAISVY
jgi:hypothetical protein